MWIIALLGGASAFIESTLAQIYKRRNPKTGENIPIPATKIPAFKAGKALKDAVDQ